MIAVNTLEHLSARFRVALTAPSPIQLPHVSRHDLPRLFRDLEFTAGAEVGVWYGSFSAALCQANSRLRLRCVDPWTPYPAWIDTKHRLSPVAAQRLMADAYAQALARLRPFGCLIDRAFSVEAATRVADRSLDFVYIDGNHGFEAVSADLAHWIPKVRSGGIVSGHDYRVCPNKPGIQVVAAVDAYTAQHQIAPWFILSADRTPSFLWVVP